jgi:hypothetical protein
MRASSHPVLLVATLFASGTCGVAQAQSPRESGGFAGVKAGINYERAEDGLSGTAVAGGVLGGFRFGRAWAAEVELWVPQSVRDSTDAEHRDVLVSVNLIRAFGTQRRRPYVLAGLGVGRTENVFTTCTDNVAVPPSLATSARIPTIVDCSGPDARERRVEHVSNATTYIIVGAGLEVPVWRMFRLTPELRAHVALGSVTLRPALGLTVDF